MRCPGDPRAGKVVVTFIFVDHLVKTLVNDHVRVAYVYCNDKNQAMQCAPNLIAAW